MLFNRSNVYDFRKIRYRGFDAMSLIAGDVGPVSVATASGVGIILNSAYEIVKTVYASDGESKCISICTNSMSLTMGIAP